MLTLAGVEIVTGWAEQRTETNPAVLEGYLRLAVEVVLRACLDAGEDNQTGSEARAWLLSPDASLYLEALGIHPDAIRDWIDSGALLPKQRGKGEK